MPQYQFEHGRDADDVVDDLMGDDVPNAKDDFGDAVRIIYDEADMYVTDSVVELIYDEALSDWELEGVKAMVRGQDVPIDTGDMFAEDEQPLDMPVLGDYHLIDLDAYNDVI